MNVILLHSNHQHFSATHAHPQVGENNNSDTIQSLQSCILVLTNLRMATLVAEMCW